MLNIKIDYSPKVTDGERQLLGFAERLAGIGDALRTPFAVALRRLITQQFTSEGAAYGSTWAKLAKSTQLAKLRAGTLNRGILVNTGAMRTALLDFTPASWRFAESQGRLSWLMSLKGAHPYVFHHLGTSRMPARQVLPSPSPRFMSELRGIVADYLTNSPGSVFSQADIDDAVRTLKERVPDAASAIDALRER